MIQCLEDMQDHFSLHRPGLRVLELGSGTGWLGLNLACQLPAAHFTLTDLDRALPPLEAHVDRVSAAFTELRLQERVRVCAADWAELECSVVAAEPWDLVIGSDLMYTHEGLSALVHAFATLLTAATDGAAPQLLYCHIPGRSHSVDEAMPAELELAGLQFLQVWPLAEGGESDSPSADNAVASEEPDGELEEPWLPDGGLFADEDEQWRKSRPTSAVFEVRRR